MAYLPTGRYERLHHQRCKRYPLETILAVYGYSNRTDSMPGTLIALPQVLCLEHFILISFNQNSLNSGLKLAPAAILQKNRQNERQ